MAPVVGLIDAAPPAGPDTMEKVNGPAPDGGVGVREMSVFTGVVALMSAAAGVAGLITVMLTVAGALVSPAASFTSYAKLGTAPTKPSAGVKAIVHVEGFTVAVPSALGGMDVSAQLKGPVPCGPGGVATIGPGPVPATLTAWAIGCTATLAVAGVEVCPYASVTVKVNPSGPLFGALLV